MRAAGERSVPWKAAAPAAVAVTVCFSALFFGGGAGNAPLVWIGGLALAGAALTAAAGLLRVLPLEAPGAPAAAYLGCLFGLAV